MLSLELVYEVLHQTLVKILSAEMGISCGGLDFKNAVLNGEERLLWWSDCTFNLKRTWTTYHIECAAAKVKNQDIALALNLLVETVGNGCRCGFIDNSHDIQAGNKSSILCSLALRVVEVSRNGDNRIRNRRAKVAFGSLSHFGQNHRGDFLGSEVFGLALELHFNDWLSALVDDLEREVLHISLHLSVRELAADQALGIEDGVLRVHGNLILGSISDETLSIREGNERWGGSVALIIGNDIASVVSEDADTTVGRAEINADRGRHCGQ
jgi:hypothetical protein